MLLDPQPLTDMQLEQAIAECKTGKLESFGVIYETHADKLYAFVLSKVLDPTRAEDVISQVFFNALEHIVDFE